VRGKWNFENRPKPKAAEKASTDEPSSFSLGVISRVKVAEGQVTAANLLASGRPGPTFFEARSVASELDEVDLNAFIASSSASLAPGADPPSGRPHTGFGTMLLYAQAPQPKPAAQGTLKADSLRFGQLMVTAVKAKLRLFPQQVHFDDLNFDLYGGRASGNLAFNFAGRNPRYSTNSRVRGVDVARLLEAFPEARGKMTGKMEGNIKLAGEVTHSPDPLAGIRGTGQLSIRDGQLPTVQLNKNLMLLARLSNLGPAAGDPSSFSSISADLNIANERLTSNKIVVVGNGVEAEGAGSMTMGGAGSLDYQGVAKVVAGQNPISNILASFSGATFAEGKLSFPFTIGGTLEAPKFNVKSAGGAGQVGGLQNILAGGAAQQGTAQPGQTPQQTPADLVQGISGLFRKKQPAQQQQPQPQPQQ
jgi:hypothetical protein